MAIQNVPSEDSDQTAQMFDASAHISISNPEVIKPFSITVDSRYLVFQGTH